MAGYAYSELTLLFDGDRPTGVNLRADLARVSHYHTIRDARSAARAEDRSVENPYIVEGNDRSDGETVHQPSAKWQDVHDLCFTALAAETKDIELLCWLAEAALRLNGIEALAEVLGVLRSLAETNFADLHSIDDETVADKVVPINGLNGGQDSDGTLIRPLRLISLAPNQIYGRLSLWDFDRARKSRNSSVLALFQQEFAKLNGDAFSKRRNAVNHCLDHINALDARLTALCGAGAPSVGRIRDVLEDMRSAYSELSVYAPLAPQPTQEALPGKDPAGLKAYLNGSGNVSPQAAAAGPIADREQAFRALLEVAAFFRRTEPHSTLPMAIETLVRRGRMDFMGLLAELIPDENQRRDMLTRAGIEPTKAKEGS